MLIALLASALGARPAYPAFSLGVASGEVESRSAKVWAHANRGGRVKAQLAFDRRFSRRVKKATLKIDIEAGLTIQKRFRGLRPGTEYWFRFCRRGGKGCSDKGRFRTPPRDGRSKKIHFAVTGDADPTALPGESAPFYGKYRAFRSMRRERNDFNVFMGDTIYSDTGVNGPAALTRAAKQAKYEEGLELRNYRKLRNSGPLYNHWDDHEFINDFSIPEDGEKLYRAGVKAFKDFAPVSFSKRRGLYRTFRWGKNVEVFFLDERSFRDAKADFGGACDNPDTGAPDLAPTAPDDKRALFSLLIPSLAQPVSQACKDALNDPGRTLLGRRQLSRFLKDVKRSKARWKLVMNETPIQQFYGLPYDRWEGYAYERVELLQRLRQEAGAGGDLVFFTTDTHAAFANVVRERTFDDDYSPANAGSATSETPFNDYVIGPVATEPFWPEIDAVTGTEGSGELLSQAFFKPDPPDGVGMMCSQGDQNSYAQVSAGKNKLRIAYKTEDGERVTDVDEEPCGPYVLKR